MRRNICILFLFFNIITNVLAEEKLFYFAYIAYGEAMTNGELNNKEKVYKLSRIMRKGYAFRASLGYYNPSKLGSYYLLNIGPYETENVCYLELQKQLKIIEDQGYKKANSIHSFPTIILSENKVFGQ